MDLVRPVGKAQRPRRGIGTRQTKVFGHPAAAVGLHGPVNHLQRHIRGRHLNHGDFRASRFIADRVHHMRRLERQQPGLLNPNPGLGDPLQRHRPFGDQFAERGSRLGAGAHLLQRALGLSYQAHAVVNTPRAKAALGNLKPPALTQNHIRGRHPHVFELDLGVTVGGIVVAEHGQHPQDIHAGRIARDQDLGLLEVTVRIIGVGLAHEDENLAARVAHARGPPFAAVDDVFIPVAHDAGLDIGGIGRGHGGFGHGKAGTNLAFEQRLQPFLLLLRRAIAGQHLHIAGVRRRTIKDFRAPMHPAHDFRQGSIFKVSQAVAVLTLRQKQVPQPGTLGLFFQLFDNRWDLPAVRTGVQLVLKRLLVRIDVILHKLRDLFSQVLYFRGKIKIHVCLSFP